ncbi:Uncharacterized protein M6B38_235000 [Iris pallida]|uniref:XS domain-containing protein n=1 Tax=Iris pallida TaxID=29817 RepID=A0AAX6DPV5_IRIPA|nr:Uncharacterized protein M6B38_235000 [Iris pallida]
MRGRGRGGGGRGRGGGGGGGGGGGRGRGRGSGDARERSPPRHRAPRRSLSPPARRHGPPRRSSSPPPLPRAHLRSPVIDFHRDREYRDRNREYRDKDQEYAVRGKQVHREQHDEGLGFQHNYMLPDHPTDLISNPNSNLQLNRSAKDRDLMAPSGITDGHGLLLQKSMFLDDGLARTYFSLPQDNHGRSADPPPVLNPTGSARGNLGIEMHHYHEHSRDPYDDIERDQGYSKDAFFSDMIAPVQLRPLGGSSSSSLPKDGKFLGFYGDHDAIGRFSNDTLKYNAYSQMQLPESLRRDPLSPGAREKPLEYDYEERSRRGRDDPLYAESDTIYRKVTWGPRSEYRDALGPSFSELAGEKVDRADASRKNLSESGIWDLPRSSHGDAVMDFHDLKGDQEDYVSGSGSGYMRLRMKSPRDHGVAPFEDGYSFERDVAPMAYRDHHRDMLRHGMGSPRGKLRLDRRSRSPMLADHQRDMLKHGMGSPRGKLRLDERPRSPMLADHHMDMLRHGASLSRGNSRFDDDLAMYDVSPERMARRRYVLSGNDPNGLDSRGMLSNDRNVHRRIRIRSPNLGDEMWSSEEDEQDVPYNTSKAAYGHSKYRMPSHRISRNDGQAQSGGSHGRTEGRGISLKKRLRTGPSEPHVSLASQRRQVLPRPYKFWKRALDDGHNDLHEPDGDVIVDDVYSKKSDPPENSEEFKQQVHKAFLRFTKLLNESPHQKKRYRDDQGRTSNLLCCVCGSTSKDFMDTHSLLTHTYHSLKLGLRTEHLGFHKALCLLMGWNWLVPPDTSKAYMSKCDVEVKALKEDLILWPPVVVMNNSSIGVKNNANAPKVITVEAMEGILKGMGFEVAKGRLCRGKPGNQSVLLLKFLPTFSGLQEAERLHKYYADRKRGREEFKKITSSNGSSREAPISEDEELMYGYMAIADDLDKLDPETKKRCHVKSKKDIEAIADAPLNTD